MLFAAEAMRTEKTSDAVTKMACQLMKKEAGTAEYVLAPSSQDKYRRRLVEKPFKKIVGTRIFLLVTTRYSAF